MKLSRRFIFLIWWPSHLAAPPGPLLWHHILVPGSQCPSQGCKRGFMRCPLGRLWRWNTSPLNHALFDHRNIPPSVSVFSLLSPYCWIALSSVFPNQFFISYFVNFALIHSKSLCGPRSSITTAITWSLLNHIPSNFPCTLRRHKVSDNE